MELLCIDLLGSESFPLDEFLKELYEFYLKFSLGSCLEFVLNFYFYLWRASLLLSTLLCLGAMIVYDTSISCSFLSGSSLI